MPQPFGIKPCGFIPNSFCFYALQMAYSCLFSRSVRAEKAKHLAVVDINDDIKHASARAIVLCELADLDDAL